MKPHRKLKLSRKEFNALREIAKNYHKFMYRLCKRRIKKKRLG